MRPNILTLLLAFFTVTIATAQLYDNRARYLRTPHDVDRFERTIYQQRKPIKSTYRRSTPTRRSYTNYRSRNSYRSRTSYRSYRPSRRSYSNYRSRVSRYARPSYGSREFYNRFRSPRVSEKYIDDKRYLLGSPETGTPAINFQCFCFVPADILSSFNWHNAQVAQINQDRDNYIKGQEEEYSKELSNRGFPKNYAESFKDQQKRFFKSYVQKFDSWFEGGKKTSYWDHKNRLVSELKNTAENFDYKFEKYMATSVVFNFLKRYKSNPRNTASTRKYVGDLIIGEQFVYDIPPSNFDNYNLVKFLLQKGDTAAIFHLRARNIYNYLRKSSNNLDDYLVDQYIKQYDNEYNLYKRFAFQSAYMIDHLRGHHLSPHRVSQINNTYDFSGYMTHIPYNKSAIIEFYMGNSNANSSHFMSFEKAKAIMAINSFPSNVKSTIEMDGNIKNSVMNYLENAIPMNYELNTIRDAINSRYNDAFKWSELPYFRTRSFQKKENPKAIMSMYLEKTTSEWFYLRQYGLEGSLIFDLGPIRFAHKMHKGIGDVLKKMYNNPIYARKEGATIRHFLKEKGLNVPSSLSNRDLGTLFDFGGGNTNTLTIEFSDYAKKYIINFHHYDGKYGTSLFTDLVKLKKLYDILKGRPVDFSNNKKPCIGDPVPNPEIAPQTNSGIQGGMHDTCVRVVSNFYCKGIKDRKLHNGVDIKNPYGAPIYAIYGGEATIHKQINKKTGKIDGAGYYTTIISKVNGKKIRMVYFHLQEKNRITGVVKAGDIIGYQGDSGNLKNAIEQGHTVSHLHIKAQENDNDVNPLNYFKTKIDPKTGRVKNPCNN